MLGFWIGDFEGCGNYEELLGKWEPSDFMYSGERTGCSVFLPLSSDSCGETNAQTRLLGIASCGRS